MTTYVLIHGGGGSAWDWHLVAAELRERGHGVVAVDLPCEGEEVGWSDYANVVVEAVGDRADLIVVGHSLGGFTAPLVADCLGADPLVLVAGMVPAPGETGMEWWANTGHDQAGSEREEREDGDSNVFYHDVPPELAEVALTQARDESGSAMQDPWPLDAWPDVPTRYLLFRDDRMFPPDFMRGVVRDRLGITPDEMDGGHYALLSRPKELADRLEAYRDERVGHNWN